MCIFFGFFVWRKEGLESGFSISYFLRIVFGIVYLYMMCKHTTSKRLRNIAVIFLSILTAA